VVAWLSQSLRPASVHHGVRAGLLVERVQPAPVVVGRGVGLEDGPALVCGCGVEGGLIGAGHGFGGLEISHGLAS